MARPAGDEEWTEDPFIFMAKTRGPEAMRYASQLQCLVTGAAIWSLAATATIALADGGNFGYYPALVVATPVVRHGVVGKDHSVPRKRGVAILSPVESPDRVNRPVGGKTVITPYYVDYCPHRHRRPRVLIPGNGVGYYAHGGAHGATYVDHDIIMLEPSGYGNYTGASRDEQRLLHLGGAGSLEEPLDPSDVKSELLKEPPPSH